MKTKAKRNRKCEKTYKNNSIEIDFLKKIQQRKSQDPMA